MAVSSQTSTLSKFRGIVVPRSDFNDFLSKIKQVKKMGSIGGLISMIPGASKALKDKEIDEKVFIKIEAIILSLTLQERENPNVLNGTRRRRIADGSGSNIQEVNRLIKQFDDMRKMKKVFSGGKMKNMLKGLKLPPDVMKSMNMK